MRFTCEKSLLVAGLNITGRTVAQKSALSAIEGILCKAGTGLSLTGYNMETAITYLIDADVSDIGQCVLPAKLFSDIVRRLPEGQVTVVVEENYKVFGGLSEAENPHKYWVFVSAIPQNYKVGNFTQHFKTKIKHKFKKTPVSLTDTG